MWAEIFKRDFGEAFRGLPIYFRHEELCVGSLDENGKVTVSRHLGMPFGTLSAVAVFHRFGVFLCVPVRVEAKAPLGRYVDDYYGASRVGTSSQMVCC